MSNLVFQNIERIKNNNVLVTVVLGDSEYKCMCTYSSETPDTMSRSNGDPGDPGDPEEFELLAVTLEFAPTVSVDILPWLQNLEEEGVSNPLERIAELARQKCREVEPDIPEPEVVEMSWEDSSPMFWEVSGFGVGV